MNKTFYFPLVSIITVNYNTDKVTAELLRSLSKITYRNIEIIVVDNASAVDASYLATEFPDIKFIQNKVNQGFAGGNNRGIEVAKGEIIFLLNNDTEVAAGFIEPVVDLFFTSDKIGIISPKIRYFHSPDIIQYAGGDAINPFTARGKFIGSGEKDNGQFNMPIETHLAHGAAMAIHRRVLDKIGLLPEMYFLYYEELDFTEHAQRAGFKVWYQPRSLVLHKESMSVGKMSAIKVYYQNRNRLLFIRRNVFGVKGLISKIFFTLISEPVAILKFLAKGNLAMAGQICKGLAWNMNYKPIKN
ncbi:glycosyltransferase family 2 protein [Mucilaginibacter psychrotolerans]|uniref:Glycosyltransferase family 2 protein n=1 Tax=Mucilaginibacter psychrotolerans TaxID=1524096 RepID=A0A4Y8S7X8_9SPHI|nr:glycosyltransferase family 2 protein [Mucilaginibacter psychrotolerans]TFF34725.1 glycosyltransferase family 2 protein [Mucilaginibacter psychrotolerans]